jgi:hypothetical protein
MDNLLAERKAVPMLIFIPNNQVVHRNNPRHTELTFTLFEAELRPHVIPLGERCLALHRALEKHSIEHEYSEWRNTGVLQNDDGTHWTVSSKTHWRLVRSPEPRFRAPPRAHPVPATDPSGTPPTSLLRYPRATTTTATG